MARYPAIATVGKTILGLLSDALPRADYDFGNLPFELYQSSNFESPMNEGISLYLYRVTINGTFRNPSPRIDSTGKRRRPPLPVDLYYMLTAWARDAEKQQILLGWAMQQLEDMPILPSSALNTFGSKPDVFYPDETVEIICEPMPVQDLVSIWEHLKTQKAKMQISVSYIARMVMIESSLELTDHLLVQTRVHEVAQMKDI
jgi:hypothetical protein